VSHPQNRNNPAWEPVKMKSEYEKRRKEMLLGLILAVGFLLLLSCARELQGRPFTTADLLVGSSEMPQGWRIASMSNEANAYIGETAIEAAAITFSTANHERGMATQRVARFRSVNEARRIYGRYFSTPLGRTPSNWGYENAMADQASIGCYDYEGRNLPVCEWAGQYEEYVVSFIVWLVPGSVSLEDVENVVRTIDARMIQYLVP